MTRNVPVKMGRENLEKIPIHQIPKGYRIRKYAPGDEDLWVRIQTAADRYNKISRELFDSEFRETELLTERMYFVVNENGEGVATATAWFKNDFEGARVGRVHWVAVLPELQGRGLGKALLTVVCQRLQELGHARTYLSTSSARLPAIGLYLHFGFTPLMRQDADEETWREIMAEIPKR